MGAIFLRVLNISITSSYAILVIFFIRRLLNPAPKKYTCLLWLIVFVKLILPYSPQTMISLMPFSSQPILLKGSFRSLLLFEIAGWIWLAGMVLILTWSLKSSFKLRKKLKKSRHLYENLYENRFIKSPFVMGLVPKIYLPAAISNRDRELVVAHEKVHIKRLDHLTKPLYFIVLIIHWFNPLVWLAFITLSSDIELSVDEEAIETLGREHKREYARTLNAMSTKRLIIHGSPLAFGENNAKGRVKNILKEKNPVFQMKLLYICFIVVLAIGLLTAPKMNRVILLNIQKVSIMLEGIL